MLLTTESKLSWLKRFEIDDVMQWMRFFSIMFKCPKNIFNFHGNLRQFGFYILESFPLLKISTCVGCLKVDFVKWLFRRAWTWQAILVANRNQRGRKVNVRFWMKNKWFLIQTRISKSQHKPNSDATQNKYSKTLLFFKQKKGLVMERRIWGSRKPPFLTCAKSGGFGASRRERSEPSVWGTKWCSMFHGREVGSIKVCKKNTSSSSNSGFRREAYHFNVSESLISLRDDIPTAW